MTQSLTVPTLHALCSSILSFCLWMIRPLDMSHSLLQPELQNGHGDPDDPDDYDPEDIYLRDRRRARSLPAYPEQASLFSRLSERCRKRVKFADAHGLNLASVRHFSIADDPQVPSKVFAALRALPAQPETSCDPRARNTDADRRHAQSFETRLAPEVVEARASRCRVTLERVSVSGWVVRGVIRANVADYGGREEVGVRYTFNQWASFQDATAVPVPGDSRRFSFTVHTPPFLEPDVTVCFAVYMRTDHGEFWDNNDEQNYRVRCEHML